MPLERKTWTTNALGIDNMEYSHVFFLSIGLQKHPSQAEVFVMCSKSGKIPLRKFPP